MVLKLESKMSLFLQKYLRPDSVSCYKICQITTADDDDLII